MFSSNGDINVSNTNSSWNVDLFQFENQPAEISQNNTSVKKTSSSQDNSTIQKESSSTIDSNSTVDSSSDANDSNTNNTLETNKILSNNQSNFNTLEAYQDAASLSYDYVKSMKTIVQQFTKQNQKQAEENFKKIVYTLSDYVDKIDAEANKVTSKNSSSATDASSDNSKTSNQLNLKDFSSSAIGLDKSEINSISSQNDAQSLLKKIKNAEKTVKSYVQDVSSQKNSIEKQTNVIIDTSNSISDVSGLISTVTNDLINFSKDNLQIQTSNISKQDSFLLLNLS